MLAARLALLIIAATLPPLSGSRAPSQPLLWGHISSFALPPGMSGVAIDVFRAEKSGTVFWVLQKKDVDFGMGSAKTSWADTRTCPAALDVLSSTRQLRHAAGYTGAPVIDGVSYSVKTRAGFPAARGPGAINSQGNMGGQTEAWFENEIPLLSSCWREKRPADIASPEPVGQAAVPSS